MDPLRVMLVDDSVLFREGLAALLGPAGVEVTGLAASPGEALVRAAKDRPTAVIMDIRMPPTFTDEGLRAARELKSGSPDLGVLLLSSHVEVGPAARLFEEHNQGIGYLLKDRVDNIESLVGSLRRVVRGELVLDPEIVAKLLRRRKNARVLEQLSEREQAVLRLMAEGRSNAAIAAELGVAVKTVETFVASVYAKLGVSSVDGNPRVLAILAWLRTRAE